MGAPLYFPPWVQTSSIQQKQTMHRDYKERLYRSKFILHNESYCISQVEVYGGGVLSRLIHSRIRGGEAGYWNCLHLHNDHNNNSKQWRPWKLVQTFPARPCVQSIFGSWSKSNFVWPNHNSTSTPFDGQRVRITFYWYYKNNYLNNLEHYYL